MKFVGKDIDEVVYKVSKNLLHSPKYFPRNLETQEIIKAELVVKNPLKCVINNFGRNLSQDYLKAEIDWYNSGETNIGNIQNHSSFWKKIADATGNVNSNYGEIVFKQKLENFPGSQYDWVIKSLIQDKDSRQAIINFNQTKHKSETKDFVCATSAHYMIREDKLMSIVDMRSNDLIYGFSYDFPFFSYLHQKIFFDLKPIYPNLKLGTAYHDANSLHVYKRHYDLLNLIVENYEQVKPESKTLEEIGLNLFQ